MVRILFFIFISSFFIACSKKPEPSVINIRNLVSQAENQKDRAALELRAIKETGDEIRGVNKRIALSSRQSKTCMKRCEKAVKRRGLRKSKKPKLKKAAKKKDPKKSGEEKKSDQEEEMLKK